MPTLARILALPAPERRLYAAAFCWTLAMRALLPWVSLRRLHRLADGQSPKARRRHPPEVVSRAVAAAACRIPGTRCLARSLALHALLKRQGEDSALRIGVRHEGGRIAAHAWVTCPGLPVDDEQIAGDYAPFEPFPG